ncbi:MAG: endolytic transglycosylase MltG [Rudaea sp.]
MLLFAVAIAAASYFYSDYRRFADAPLAPLTSNRTLDISLGTPLPGILRELRKLGVHPGPQLYWRALARQMAVAGRLHAGEYALDPGLTPRGLFEKMAANQVIQHQFTIVDGWTFAQLRGELAEQSGLRQTLTGIDAAAIMSRLGATGTPAEGWFLPETYNYVAGMSDLDILRRAHVAMQQALDRLWGARDPDLPLTDKYQALILASIVERETGRADERAKIAAVFEHRLKLGMKLQTDPTVIYGLGARYDGNLHRRDLESDTPYNTYTRTGLPPTPIALPGMAALTAVLHPEATNALFFVARGDGSHQFSATLHEHDQAVAKYQLKHK